MHSPGALQSKAWSTRSDHRSMTLVDLHEMVDAWMNSLMPIRIALKFGYFCFLRISNTAPPTADILTNCATPSVNSSTSQPTTLTWKAKVTNSRSYDELVRKSNDDTLIDTIQGCGISWLLRLGRPTGTRHKLRCLHLTLISRPTSAFMSVLLHSQARQECTTQKLSTCPQAEDMRGDKRVGQWVSTYDI